MPSTQQAPIDHVLEAEIEGAQRSQTREFGLATAVLAVAGSLIVILSQGRLGLS